MLILSELKACAVSLVIIVFLNEINNIFHFFINIINFQDKFHNITLYNRLPLLQHPITVACERRTTIVSQRTDERTLHMYRGNRRHP